jgi:protein-S-isoprenylcysteine O-methyltransferase Ste14
LRAVAPLPVGPPLPAVGSTVLGLGFALAVWSLLAMVRAGTDPRPDKPDATLLERGPFRFSRNPVYLGFLLVVAGLALRWADLWTWVGVAASAWLLDRLVVAREEVYLRTRFGAAYDAYARRVRRWL